MDAQQPIARGLECSEPEKMMTRIRGFIFWLFVKLHLAAGSRTAREKKSRPNHHTYNKGLNTRTPLGRRRDHPVLTQPRCTSP